jgi:hypothetical protein
MKPVLAVLLLVFSRLGLSQVSAKYVGFHDNPGSTANCNTNVTSPTDSTTKCSSGTVRHYTIYAGGILYGIEESHYSGPFSGLVVKHGPLLNTPIGATVLVNVYPGWVGVLDTKGKEFKYKIFASKAR